ncbi:MAG: glycerophosphodiester phosphodiesterase [Moraxellaceae bacterium]|nr:MAG: glycerophosphodiester phosphodiesterase [Moraxellaceae bacterium]
MSKPMCIAHRGGPLMANQLLPENSLAAIKRALDAGISAIEIDIYQVEGELLVTHDRRLGRVVSGQGIITNLPLAYLREQTLSNGEAIPTLHDVLALVGERALLNIEIKGPDSVFTLQRTLTAFCSDHQISLDQYVVSSFDHQQLYQCTQALPAVRRGVLIEGVPLDYAQCCEALDAHSFNTHLGFLTTELLADARKRGLQNWVYTANNEDEWALLAGLDVDAIFTDKPDAFENFKASKLAESVN